MESVKFTLYEIVGYLIPGTVSLVSLIIGYSLLNNNIVCFQNSSFSAAAMLVGAYFAGHLNQGIGNLFSGYFENMAIAKRNTSISDIKSNINIDKNLSDRESFGIIMNIAMSKMKTESMVIFTEREGFYRGSAVGFALLSISIIISMFFDEIKFVNGEYFLLMKYNHKLYLLIISLTSVLLFFYRYLRFLKYRINVMIDAHK